MKIPITKARHVFMPETSGWDRVHAWQESTGEPVFTFGLHEGIAKGAFFRSIKGEFKAWLNVTNEDTTVTVYHDGAGADVLGPLDPAAHKILFQHQWFPRWTRSLDFFVRCTGKIMVGSGHLAALLHEQFAWIPDRYIQVVLPAPLVVNEAGPPSHALSPRTGIWLHGRSWRRYGNRLRAIVDRWDPDVGPLEIVVEGRGTPRWARKPFVRWSSGMPLEFALYRLFTWDSTLLLDDYSLDAPWLLHALNLGCFCLVPEGDGPAREGHWTAENAPAPYPWGEIPAALELLRQWRTDKDTLQPRYLDWTRTLLDLFPDTAAFLEHWQQAKGELFNQRPSSLRKRRPVPGWYPVRWYERIQRLRAGF